MGLLPLTLLRERRESFVELYSYDDQRVEQLRHGWLLGNGYFITVKHGVIALGQDGAADPRKIVSIKLMYKGRPLAARVVDSGDAKVEVDPGDWAIVKVKEPIDLPALNVNLAYAFDFADPIFRLGNDYSKGIILSTGYVGQRTAEQPGDVPDRRPPGRVWRRRAEPQRRARRHPDRPDAGRLPLLVHPPAAAGDVQEDPALQRLDRGLRPAGPPSPSLAGPSAPLRRCACGAPNVRPGARATSTVRAGPSGPAALTSLSQFLQPLSHLGFKPSLGRLCRTAVLRAPEAGTASPTLLLARRARTCSPSRSPEPS